MNSFKPEGFQCITPYLTLRNLAEFVDFAEKGLGAIVLSKVDHEGTVHHAEFQFGDSMVMAGEAKDETSVAPAMLYFYVPDCDAAHKKALNAGASSILEPQDQVYGDRNGAVKDRWGNQWWFATHKEKVSEEEIAKRMEQSQ